MLHGRTEKKASLNRRLLLILGSIVALLVLLLVTARTLGPVWPLESLVSARLSHDGVPAGIADHNPMANSRAAAISWQIDGRDVYVNVYQGDAQQTVVEKRTFGSVLADSLDVDYGSTWRFRCKLNSLLFDYGTMNVLVIRAEDPAFAVPYVHNLLRCG